MALFNYKTNKVLPVLTFVLLTVSATSSDLCSVCTCREIDDSLTIDCNAVNLREVPIEWPKDFVNDTTCADKLLTVIFTSNNWTRLEQFPPLNCKRIAMFIRKNELKEITYATFKNLKNMYYLNLGQNQLTSDIVRGDVFRGAYNDRLYEPSNLEVLHLDNNKLHSLNSKMFLHTPYLKHLYLTNNPLEMLDSLTTTALESLHKLETLDLSYTGISTIPDQIMKNKKQLRDLRLSGNKFKTIPESLGFVGATLRKLVFDDNLVEEINDNSFLGLWRLESLEIGAMDTLTKVKSDAFGQLVSLKMLHLCHNKNLKEIDHNAFENLRDKWPLKELYIHDNGLTTISKDLVSWDQLVSINLDNNPWECDCQMAAIIQKNNLGKLIPPTSTPRCLTPLEVAGQPLTKLRMETSCSRSQLFAMRNLTGQIVAPQFMKGIINRPRNAFIGFIFVCVVVVFGMVLGCCVTYVRGKLNRDFFMQPIRYRNLNTVST